MALPRVWQGKPSDDAVVHPLWLCAVRGEVAAMKRYLPFSRPLSPRAVLYAAAWRGWVRRNQGRFAGSGWLELPAERVGLSGVAEAHWAAVKRKMEEEA